MERVAAEMDRRLIEKYGARANMYVEYPLPRFWSEEFGQEGLQEGLHDLFSMPDVPVQLYVHMPYCRTQCLFCTCHVVISKKYDDVKAYLPYLYKEIALYRDFFARHGTLPNFKEIHLGGGSPTYLREQEFDEMIAEISTIADIKNLDEFALEIDPRGVKEDSMEYYAKKGINRISFGVQDFDLAVQKAVNRVQPAMLTERLMTPELRKLFPRGVNFDIICGLPHQTVDSMRSTMETVVAMSPDRVCLNYLDFSEVSSSYHPHQLLMPKDAIPNNYARKLLFIEALNVLESGGYMRVGYDHFVKPSDDVARAMTKHSMAWNRLGVTPGRCMDVLGIGVHSSSRLGSQYYSQNVYELPRYFKAVSSGEFPVYKGMRLSRDDVMRREVIHGLRSYFMVNFGTFTRTYDINFPEYFRAELDALDAFEEDGIVYRSDSGMVISDMGRQFADRVCRIFDVYIR